MYDFIVVGGGPAGASLATRLAQTKHAPEVLLLEAGAENRENQNTPATEKRSSMAIPKLNWGYKTAPQENFLHRQADYSRGKTLGGTSVINFMVWSRGPRDDYEEWAERVGDSDFNWTNAERLYKSIEGYDVNSGEMSEYFKPDPLVHGTSGPISIENGQIWPEGLHTAVDAIVASGVKLNLDLNSGDPLGLGLIPFMSRKGLRCTASAYTDIAPSNLTLQVNTLVTKLIFEKNKVIGVQTDKGKYLASKEVILAAGAVDTPKILLLSGIGPADHLKQHGIPVVVDLPVGENLRDHSYLQLLYELNDSIIDKHLINSPELLLSARAQFAKDGTGPFTAVNRVFALSWTRDELVEQRVGFADLAEEEKRLFRRSTIPTHEFSVSISQIARCPGKILFGLSSVGMNMQSRGTVRLASADPADAPIIDPKFLSHAFDRDNLVGDLRRMIALSELPDIKSTIKGPLGAPASSSDEDIWDFVRKNMGSCWHPCGTVKMGKADDPEACVDSEFAVKHFEGLRVVDLSVAPFVPSCHTTSTAYWLGELAAEKIARRYGLNG
ncbi:alcohol oxidase [Rhizodiscina lignyota]|uniref:Alcohol oxidase n=1 Tax=Rhizodiscina lignyota TaxID=1504668 RepID=A0A9P4ICL1_9PEZI|nr:alcohol oxidase [Rhizodiscina lignyota]